jgi:FixJ family two-component response regulator
MRSGLRDHEGGDNTPVWFSALPSHVTVAPRSAAKHGKERCVSKEHLIAVIDDDETFRGALVDSLCSLGYGVRGFASAENFVAAGEENSYDCVITDIHMPGMSGLDLKKLLAAHDSKVPVIMITARAEPVLEARAVASGAVCLLRKPFEANALIACLEAALKVR